jgi:hypothetical protein
MSDEHEIDDGLTAEMRAKLDELGMREYPVKLVPVDRIRRYNNNPRRNEKAVAKLVAIISEVGFQQHLVLDAEGVIIVGDTRYLAGVELGYPALPCKYATDLTPEQVRLYRIADNRVHEEADWDDAKLGEELHMLESTDIDLSLTGFDDAELDKLLGTTGDEAELTAVEVKPLPTMTWVLIGIPTPRFVEISEEIERISSVPDILCELTANSSDMASAGRKAAKIREKRP